MAANNEAVENDSTDADADSDIGVGMIVNETTLQDTLDTVGALVDECKIHLNEDNVVIRAVDPANVGMVDVTLDAAALEYYNGNDGVIGVNLDRLTNIAGMADSDQLISLELNEETRKLHIKFDGLEYTLALIDPDSIREEPDLPDLDLPTDVVLEEGELSRGLKAADMVSDHIRLRADKTAEEFYMSAEGDTDDTNLTLTRDDLIDFAAGDADSLYSLDYLKDMVSSMPTNVAVTMELGEEFPVKMHFDYADGTGHATYLLAPRIQSE